MAHRIHATQPYAMLSYRHAFHAGNYADVLKHYVLVQSLEYLMQKPASLLYIDTHAGAGSYTLNSDMSQKTGEYKEGAGALDFNTLPDSFEHFGQILSDCAKSGSYPGSPKIAAACLRKQDRLALFELHPSDEPKLKKLFQKDRRVQVSRADGHHALKALLPAAQKRALVLMDPSFEVKEEYRAAVDSLQEAYKRMPNATLLLWYPVVKRAQINDLIKHIRRSKMRDVWQFELGLRPDSEAFGMSATGMIAVNPAWTLPGQLEQALPALKQQLAPENGFYRIEQIVPE